MPHTAADCVRAICQDRDLLRTLRVYLQSLEPDELAEAVAAAAQQDAHDQVILLFSTINLMTKLYIIYYIFNIFYSFVPGTFGR